jgi:hypothetical protein
MTRRRIDYDSLIAIITELCDRIEQLEKDNKNSLNLMLGNND